MPEISSPSFSETDSLNNAPAPSGFPEGMNMSGLNDSGRAVMGALKRFWGRSQGRYASTGSADAYVLTPDVALSSYVIGERYSFRASFANTGAATVNISGLGAKAIRKVTSAGKANLAAGDIQNGQPVTVEYDGTDCVLVTPAANALSAGTVPISVSGSTISFDASYLRNYIAGLTLSNNGADAANDIDIAAGVAVDSAGAAIMKLTNTLTKRLDASWAVGSGNGGLDTGLIANDVYHLWLIQRSDTGVVDALFSASATSPTMPANYDRKRRIGAVIRVTGALLAFTQSGDEFRLAAGLLDVNAITPGTSAVTRALTVPDGVTVDAIVNGSLLDNGQSNSAYLSPLSASDEAPSATVAPLSQMFVVNGVNTMAASWGGTIKTNTSAQIRTRVGASGASTILRIATLGWIDSRGKGD